MHKVSKIMSIDGLVSGGLGIEAIDGIEYFFTAGIFTHLFCRCMQNPKNVHSCAFILRSFWLDTKFLHIFGYFQEYLHGPIVLMSGKKMFGATFRVKNVFLSNFSEIQHKKKSIFGNVSEEKPKKIAK